MSELKIKFSHYYTKMPVGETEAVLFQVFETTFQELSEDFKRYDTQYIAKGQNLVEPIGYYELPKNGKCIVLIFSALHDDCIFTTIRSAWPTSKVDYYKNSIGKVFKLDFVKNT